jgi:flagellar biosynthesis/type III secretory pathway protein FliH
LFVHAPELSEVPAELPSGPYRDALELANQATFSEAELDAYQKVTDEIEQVRELAAAKWAEGEAKGEAKGRAEGEAKGEAKGKAAALLAFLGARGISVSDKARAHIEACQDAPTLDHWITRAATSASAEEVIASPAQPS